MSNLALNGYLTLSDLDYLSHKEFEAFYSTNIIQDLNRGVANYSDKVIKLLQRLVWRASKMKRLNQPLLIKTNLIKDKDDEC